MKAGSRCSTTPPRRRACSSRSDGRSRSSSPPASCAPSAWPASATRPSAFIQGLSVSVIGITVFAMAALRRTNADLVATRQELATLAVAEERHRIARDLHDLLGHSLSLIAIKSELAGRLLPGDPERARSEIADVEQVARDSLASVRETVGGYRQPTLERELANAKVVLDAAGIEPTIDHRVGELPEPEDTVLAWVLREAVTNVVRHSAAHHGTIRTTRTGATAALEVVDDGSGPATATPRPTGADSPACGNASNGSGGGSRQGTSHRAAFDSSPRCRYPPGRPVREHAPDPSSPRRGPVDGARGDGRVALDGGRSRGRRHRSRMAPSSCPRRSRSARTSPCSTSRCPGWTG